MIFVAEPRLPPELELELEVAPLLDVELDEVLLEVEPDEVLLVVPLLLEVELDGVLPSVGVVPPPPQAKSRSDMTENSQAVLEGNRTIIISH
jgi:hypothetical protein